MTDRAPACNGSETLQFENEAEREFWRDCYAAHLRAGHSLDVGREWADKDVLACRARSAKLREEGAKESPMLLVPDGPCPCGGKLVSLGVVPWRAQCGRCGLSILPATWRTVAREEAQQPKNASPAAKVASSEANGSQGGGEHG